MVVTMTGELPDIRQVEPYLFPPSMTKDDPAPGRRVRQTAREYAETEVYHALYLPTDWQPGNTYPVIVDYAGNGPYSNTYGDTCTGRIEDCHLGYGISGGEGFIWICLPYISADHHRNQLQWWGDPEATVAYCKLSVRRICAEFGGDPNALLLAGFSRGAIACNYIGLRDDEIAALWQAFIVHSHYDGVQHWPHADSDRDSALERLQRLRGRPQFISHEGSTEQTEQYLQETEITAPFTFCPLPYRNHTDSWVLRNIPERHLLCKWLQDALAEPPEKA